MVERVHYNQSTKGFTLVELSIVIVIIGLIVAGVTAGQSLVKQARLRSLVSDAESYKVAINAFKLEYSYLPGDFPNASSFWPTCHFAFPNGCNGNGNKFIDLVRTDGDTEYVHAWQQLGDAGLVKGTYNGVIKASNPGVNCPATSISKNSCFNPTVQQLYYRNSINNALVAGTITTSSNIRADESLLTSSESSSIDSKIDDGDPSRGNVVVLRGRAYGADATKCVSAASSAASATYLLNDTVVSCAIFFLF